MGSRKGMRAQEQQARQDRELSGAGAGFREPDPQRDPATRRDPDTGRRSIEEPPADDEAASTLAPSQSQESDDIENFEDDDKSVDEENDLA